MVHVTCLSCCPSMGSQEPQSPGHPLSGYLMECLAGPGCCDNPPVFPPALALDPPLTGGWGSVGRHWVRHEADGGLGLGLWNLPPAPGFFSGLSCWLPMCPNTHTHTHTHTHTDLRYRQDYTHALHGSPLQTHASTAHLHTLVHPSLHLWACSPSLSMERSTPPASPVLPSSFCPPSIPGTGAQN